MTDFAPGIEARLHMIRENRGAICVVLGRAVLGGLEANTAVAIVADTTDPIGYDIAEAVSGKAGLDVREEAERIVNRGETPTFVLVIPLDAAMEIFHSTHPSVTAGLDKQPPAGCVRCVAIAAGAAMLVHADVRPMAPIAEA